MFRPTRICMHGAGWKRSGHKRPSKPRLGATTRRPPLSSTPSHSPAFPTATTKSLDFRRTPTVMAASFGYALPTPFNPLAPSYNPLQHKPLGQVNMPFQPPPTPHAVLSRDQITQPSPESGGVPDPDPEYLALASHPPFQLPQPRNLLVVIDLNGTLLHRPTRKKPVRFVERPYAREFLSYCINTFSVVIWSSARPDNVSAMYQKLVEPEDHAKVIAVWARDRFNLTKSDYNLRVQCYKRLTYLWKDPVIRASALGDGDWTQLNTVLIDDSIEKARSEPFNLLQLPEFTGNANEPGFILPQVHDYLNECSQQINVSAFIRSQPFKIKPEFTL
ncbi:hypothetical protein F5Y08DRAFT_301086 [Xylaria arbuscula]|nr:hypothetical protein F5Y08DRAFT_301086 [Xylaria arbuscula]